MRPRMVEPPLPIAALMLRARNAKWAKERHDLDYFGWEASVRLAVATAPPDDRTALGSPSAGHWIAAVTHDDRTFDAPDLLAVQQLFAWVAFKRKDEARLTTRWPACWRASLPIAIGSSATVRCDTPTSTKRPATCWRPDSRRCGGGPGLDPLPSTGCRRCQRSSRFSYAAGLTYSSAE